MVSKNSSIKKQAADSVAEEYWENYYKDTGYGKLWVKKIPMRIKAALNQQITKSASAAGKTAAPVAIKAIHPIASVFGDNEVSLEGLAVVKQGGVRKLKAFSVDFDGVDGSILSFDSMDVK